MADSSVGRGWAIVAVVLTGFGLAGVTWVVGLEKMSWIAAGGSLVLAMVAAFGGSSSGAGTGVGGGDDGGRSRPVLQRSHKIALAAGLAVVIGSTALVKAVVPAAAGSEAEACPGPSDPVTQAPVRSTRVAAHPSLAVTSFAYSLFYGADGTMELEPTGQLSEPIPPGQMLYPFGWADPGSRDSTPEHNPGSGRYLWGHSRQIFPDANGCWAQPRRAYGGYSGARGLTFRMYFGLVPRAQLHCLQGLVATEAGREHGQTLDELTGCGVTLLGYAVIPTQPE
ncbi:hypothetical protein [Nonomuraea sp. NPDC050310]|uniref:hypothetical protein n=1 Tax=Nonomuraea sp. NPDC050310 TaxID=3154935 RepID=UPI0033CB1FE0